MSWSYVPSTWSTTRFISLSDYQDIAADIQTFGGPVDASGYGLAQASFLQLLKGDLPGTSYTVTNASWAAGSATLTIGAHNMAVGQHFSASSIVPSGFNTSDSVLTAVTSTTISYAVGTNPGVYVSGGPVVVGITAPAAGMLAIDPTGALKEYNGSIWVTVSGTFTGITSLTGDVTAAGTGSVIATVVGLQGFAVSNATPTSGQVLQWNSGSNEWVPTSGGSFTANATNIAAVLFGTGAGTGNAQTVTLSPAITSLTVGLRVQWIPAHANTITSPPSAPTLAVSGLTATAIIKAGGAALAAGDLSTTAVADAIYDGTYFELQNPQTTSGGGGSGSPYTYCASGCSTTVPAGPASFTITAAVHGQGVNAYAYGFDSSNAQLFNLNVVRNSSGDLTISYVTAPSRIIIASPGGAGGGGGGISALTADVTASGTGSVAATVVALQGNAVSNVAPTNGYVLQWNSSSGKWTPTAGGGTMIYPGAGVANSTGGAWGTSYAVGTAANDLVQLNGSAQLPAVSGALLTGISLTAGVSGVLPGANGGTGVSNTGYTLTLAGNVVFSGAFNPTFSIPATGTWTFPAAGTLVNTAVTSLPSLNSANGTTIPASATLTQTIASGAQALGTAAIAAGATTTLTVSASGVLSTDVVIFTPNANISSVTGYGTSTPGLGISIDPSANNINIRVSNYAATSITPGALTINWRVVR